MAKVSDAEQQALLRAELAVLRPGDVLSERHVAGIGELLRISQDDGRGPGSQGHADAGWDPLDAAASRIEGFTPGDAP